MPKPYPSGILTQLSRLSLGKGCFLKAPQLIPMYSHFSKMGRLGSIVAGSVLLEPCFWSHYDSNLIVVLFLAVGLEPQDQYLASWCTNHRSPHDLSRYNGGVRADVLFGSSVTQVESKSAEIKPVCHSHKVVSLPF